MPEQEKHMEKLIPYSPNGNFTLLNLFNMLFSDLQSPFHSTYTKMAEHNRTRFYNRSSFGLLVFVLFSDVVLFVILHPDSLLDCYYSASSACTCCL